MTLIFFYEQTSFFSRFACHAFNRSQLDVSDKKIELWAPRNDFGLISLTFKTDLLAGFDLPANNVSLRVFTDP